MSDSTPWIAAEAGPEAKKHAPATLRNRDAIADVLATILPAEGLALEIASGSGEHIVHFAARFEQLDWQPSDPDAEALRSIDAYRDEAGFANLRASVALDVMASVWPLASADAILCINMIHIAPWPATAALMSGAGRLLAPGAPLFLYGPFRENGVELAPGNVAFDASLKARNPDWGLREVSAVASLAASHGLIFEQRHAMPANNLSLIFRKSAG